MYGSIAVQRSVHYNNQRRKEEKKVINPSIFRSPERRGGSMAALRLFVFTLFLSFLLLAGSISAVDSDVDDEPGSNGVDELSSKIRSLGECPP